MKTTLMLAAAFAVIFFSCKNKQQNKTDNTDSLTVKNVNVLPDFSKEKNFYQKFTGTVGDKQVTLNLEKLTENISMRTFITTIQAEAFRFMKFRIK